MKITAHRVSSEPRRPITDASKTRLESLGLEVLSDNALDEAHIIADVGPPDLELIESLHSGAIYIGHMNPFFQPDLAQLCANQGLTAICMELVPRSTLAQSMDALSSQASLAGYQAVLMAAARSAKAFPMMTTAAGGIKPARVLVVGAGVAGLQAIATAKRLGAQVSAYDTRPAAAEQIESLGAKALKIDVGETGQTAQGYAKELTQEQLEEQQHQLHKAVEGSDVVITTAQVFGRPAPLIVTANMVRHMRPGAVCVDLAVGTGGNIAGVKPGETITENGVVLIGLDQGARHVADDGSFVYANNIARLIEHMWDPEAKALSFDFDDEIISAVTLVHDGQIRDPRILEALDRQQQGKG